MVALPLNLRRWISAMGVVLAAGAALPALADPLPSKDGLLILPNVRVVNAPELAATAPKSVGQGMTAAVDSSGKLRPLTSEEAQRLAPAKAQSQLGAASERRAAAAAQSDTAAAETIYGPDNTVTVMLSDESLVYQVVRKTDEGLAIEEYTGKSAADRAVTNPLPQPKSKQEVGHDHR